MVNRLKRTTLSYRQERALEKTLQNIRAQRRNRFRVLACINEDDDTFITVRFAARLAPDNDCDIIRHIPSTQDGAATSERVRSRDA